MIGVCVYYIDEIEKVEKKKHLYFLVNILSIQHKILLHIGSEKYISHSIIIIIFH